MIFLLETSQEAIEKKHAKILGQDVLFFTQFWEGNIAQSLQDFYKNLKYVSRSRKDYIKNFVKIV